MSKFIIIAVLFLVCSCKMEDPYVHDKFTSKNSQSAKEPQSILKSSSPPSEVPDYYYRQPTYPNQSPSSTGYANGYAGAPQQQYQNQQSQQNNWQNAPQYQQQVMPQQYQQVPQYAPAPQQYYQPNPYAVPQYVQPGSRFYSNPYAIPPTPQPRIYYDADQYYSPPNSYQQMPEENRSNILNKSIN